MRFVVILPLFAIASTVTAKFELNECELDEIDGLARREALLDAYNNALDFHKRELILRATEGPKPHKRGTSSSSGSSSSKGKPRPRDSLERRGNAPKPPKPAPKPKPSDPKIKVKSKH
ncbi:unnamed protein product [Clonostachys rosea]|uniref:Uncharacterized protein n=1 Tax=Bionectria ochroleuca TaxID=29856 RepID=A0ABY6UCC4_BIOOC|nr:unnamed protein product [Clonostachys rosea]